MNDSRTAILDRIRGALGRKKRLGRSPWIALRLSPSAHLCPSASSADKKSRALPDQVGTGWVVRKRSKCMILEQIIPDQMILSGRGLL